MRPVSRIGAVAGLSIVSFGQAVHAQISGNSPQTESTTLEEVVVTAQKREERLQDVPISISVLSGSALEQSSDRGVIEAVNRVPGVSAPQTANGARYGGNSVITVRGVSSPSTGSGTTGYYLDNIPFGLAQQSFVPDSNPYDLERVEVLRGPQGTLYGANALNGVVRILTKNPDLSQFDFKARASVAGTDHGKESYSGDAAFNLPLIQDKLAARIVLGYQDLGGWLDKPTINQKDTNGTTKSNVRVKLAAELTDRFSAGVSAWFSRVDNDSLSTSTDGGYTTPSRTDDATSTDFDAYSLELNYDAGFMAIRSATSYLDSRISGHFNSSYPEENGVCFLCLFSPSGQVILFNDLDSDVFTEELVLRSQGEGPWRWTFGSMYRDAKDYSLQNTSVSVSKTIYYAQSKSIAVYGELTRLFADGQFELTGGLRYFRDKVHNWELSRASIPLGALPGGIPPGGLQSIEDTFSKTTPRVVLTWHPNDDSTVYASYSQGFRSGVLQGFDVAAARPDLQSANPDTLTNYEIGGKAGFGRFTFDAAAYYIDWKDVQQTITVPTPPTGLGRPGYFNGKSASGPGVDLSLAYAPVDSLTLGLNYGWNDLTYDAPVYGNAAQTVLLIPKGGRRNASPETTAGATVDYSVLLGGSGYRGRLSAGVNYVSSQISDFVSTTGVALVAESLTLVRAGLTVNAPRNWTGTLYVDNATDEEGVFPAASQRPYYNTVIRPRTIGLQFEYKY